MNYFIDFEATQFSQEIISVGCIREDGETFYALVAPRDGKITPFITNLTGITAEMLQTAMSSDNVFEMFYDWAFANNDIPNFYVWGTSDVDFLRHTFKRTTSMKARMAIGYIAGSIRDYADYFCKQTKLHSCALKTAYNTLIDSNYEQTHNALDDAVMLAQVYKHTIIMNKEELQTAMANVISSHTSHKTKLITWSQAGLPTGTICIINNKKEATHQFTSMEEAVQYVRQHMMGKKESAAISDETLAAGIQRAYRGGKPYRTVKWRKIKE